MQKSKHIYSSSKIALALAAMTFAQPVVQAQTAPPKRPQLVVGIVVDGLKAEYLDLLNSYFSDGGFRRLMNNGITIENVDYGTAVDNTAATAMLYTGAAPSVNGIPASEIYDKERKVAYSIFLDSSKIGNFTDETYSPAAMLVSTLSDEVRIDNSGLGAVHAIAPDAQSAIIMGGHAGNSAFWISDVNGKWATTTFYKDVPTTISTRNFTSPLSARLDTMVWTPSLPIESYPDLPDFKKYYPFRYHFSAGNRDRFNWFKKSAPGNMEITNVAIDYITNLNLGKHESMDMLNIGYSLAHFPGVRDSDDRVEQMDSYIKLDADINRLFHAIDSSVGLNNTFIFLAGTPAQQNDKPDDPRWAIPYGEFSTRKAVSLLNMYLIALHGNGEWVKGYHNGQVFLNTQLIKDKGLDIREIRSVAASFLARMSGVSQSWTIDDIEASKVGNNPLVTRRNTSVKRAGDIFLSVTPGWDLVDDLDQSRITRHTQRPAATTSPLFIMSPALNSGRIDTPVDVLEIAPTIARLLRIRSPNAAANPTISAIFAPTFKK